MSMTKRVDLPIGARRIVAYAGIALALIVASSDGFAARTGNCQTCFTFADPAAAVTFSSYVAPDNWGWGHDHCQVTCDAHGDVGGCWCVEDGFGCLYVEVNG
ncbi:MAG: hypothetical protein JWN02_2379 [Acidobacteria bacterium]|nr:hypothetical protein [Acidobacteriota bacterium]